MATTLLAEPVPTPSRAAQRKQRLLELENEQRLEDAEALKMTEEQRLSLFHSFRSVKFEWSDLDGMRSVRRRYNSPAHRHPSPPRPAHFNLNLHLQHQHAHAHQHPAFAVLINAAEDAMTVRAHARFPASPISSPHSSHAAQAPHPHPHGQMHSPQPQTPATATAKTRSPVKGLFPASNLPSASVHSPISAPAPAAPHISPPTPTPTPTPTPILVPLPPLCSAQEEDEDDEDENEDAWVDDDDEEEEGEFDDEGEELDGEEGNREGEEDESALPTPIAPRARRFADTLAFELTPAYDDADAYGYNAHEHARDAFGGSGTPYPTTPVPHSAPPTPTPTLVSSYSAPPTPTPVPFPTSASSYGADQVGGKRKR
ncbi:hypothetical protein C8R44DRAFT_724698 [Mycena epipterygia]|nr:hypothetical protein C8R44DRAFT_724698 [Mycena epipterygia]